MNWTNVKVLVTGAGGFIGSHLCTHLLELGASVTAMLHYSSRSDWANLEFISDQEKRQLNVVKGNVEDPSFVEQQLRGAEVVFHLAALIGIPYSYLAPLSYVRTNIQGTVNILEAVRRLGTNRLVHISTSEVYGTARYTPIDEMHPIQAQSPYSATKHSADKLCESYHNSFDVPLTIVRPFNTFGPRQTARAIIPTIISQALACDRIRLGDLTPVRDLSFVDDTVRGMIRAAETPSAVGELLNLGFGKGISIGELANVIKEELDSNIPVITDESRFRPAKSEVFKLVSDNTKARNMMDWQPTVGLREGLRRTIEFVRLHPDLYRASDYTV